MNNCHDKHPTLPAPVLESLRSLIDYVYDDEQQSFEAADGPEDHIFEDIRRIDAWLNKLG